MTDKQIEEPKPEEILGIKLYTLKEVSVILGVTERTLLTYIKNEKLKAQKIGGKWKISEENLKKYVSGE